MAAVMHTTPKPATSGHSDMTAGFGHEGSMQFDTIAEELDYYKDKYQQVADLLEETRNELGKLLRCWTICAHQMQLEGLGAD
jgi:agmatine/peptidylarginine deiminase